MIFVTVGTQGFQLNRLLKQIDLLIEDGSLTEPVFAQIGHSDYVPKHYEYRRFLGVREFEKTLREASLVITHSGVATIVKAKKLHKPVIVFPRLAKYKEHVDDHQVQITENFVEQGLILGCKDESNLLRVIELSKKFEFREYRSNRDNALKLIRNYIDQWSEVE